MVPAADWSSISLSGVASPSKAVSLDVVAATLEKDLEDERRERRQQVAFLNRIGEKERELLVNRAEAFQRQLVEAQQLWKKERELLKEQLSTTSSEEESFQRLLELRRSEQSPLAAVFQWFSCLTSIWRLGELG